MAGPLYRQIAEEIRGKIDSGPATGKPVANREESADS